MSRRPSGAGVPGERERGRRRLPARRRWRTRRARAAARPVLHAGCGRGLGRGGRRAPVSRARLLGLPCARRRGSSSCSTRSARAPTGSRRSQPGERMLARRPARDRFHRAAALSSAGALLVAGGIGIAPLVILGRGACATPEREPRVLAGFRSRARASGGRCLPATCGSRPTTARAGHHGLVTELLEARAGSAMTASVYACGPPAMLEAVRAICAECAVPAQLAMEEAMACGFGACFGCVVRTTSGYRRICVDGPVVDGGRPRRDVARALTADARHGVDRSAGLELDAPGPERSGTFDAIAALRDVRRRAARALPVRGLRLQDDHAGAPRRATLRRACGRPPPG